MDCLIIINDKEYTHAEFKEYVKSNGLGSLLGDNPTQLAQNIVNKFNISTEDSLDELWTKLEMAKKGLEVPQKVTKDLVEEHLSPQGQLSDYATQEEIRYNTYSGIDLTGISANFGKTLAYVLDSAAVAEVRNKETGEIIDVQSPKFAEILESHDAFSVEGLLERSDKYELHAKEDVLLNEDKHIKVDGVVHNSFPRRVLTTGQNIFEVIDTIINLAIDNVKEQKLNVLGITSVNANVYMSMLGMGMSLQTVSKIFKTPLVKLAGEESYWRGDSLSKYTKNTLEELLQSKNLQQLLTEYSGSEARAKEIMSKLNGAKNPGNILANELGINTEILDKIYTGQIIADLETVTLKDLSDIIVFETIKKTIPIGEELFEYAQVFSTLKSIPNKKWKIDSVIAKIENRNTFKTEASNAKKDKEALKMALSESFKEQDQKYLELVKESPEEAEAYVNEEVSEAMKKTNYFGTLKAAIRASFVNRMIRGDANKTPTPRNSVFKNVSILRLPHVLSTYKVLLQIRAILENSFAVYNPVVNDFVVNILEEANIYGSVDALEKVEIISKELLKFISADMTFELEGKEFTTSVPDSETYQTVNKTLNGKEAWAQKFVNKTATLWKDSSLEENAFLRGIEFSKVNSADGTRNIIIVADKVNDEEVLEQIREAFLNLSQDQTPIEEGYTRADWALDLFKYSIMSEGLFYEKTGFSLIFPTHWMVKYGVSLDSRLDSVLPKASPVTDVNLQLIKDRFLFQFLKNNTSLVTVYSKSKPIVQERVGSLNKMYNVYSGVRNIDGRPVYFDLEFADVPSEFTPKFIKMYGDDVYMRIPTTSTTHIHYVKITEGSASKFYTLDTSMLFDSLDLSPLAAGDVPLINTNSIRNNTLALPLNTLPMQVGQVFKAFGKSSANSNSIKSYRVTKVTKLNDKYIYSVHFLEENTINRETEALKVKEFISRFLPNRLGTTLVVDSLKKYREHAMKTKGSTVLLTNPSDPVGGARVLPIEPIAPNATAEEKDIILKNILSAIEKLDRNINYYISADILKPLDGESVIRKKVADALKNKIGFRELKAENEQEQEVLHQAVKRALKERELLSHVLNNRAVVTSVTGEIHTHTTPLKGQAKSVPVGSVISSGGGKYFYVVAKDESSLHLLEFPQEVFDAMSSPIMSLETFLTLYASKIKC